jgi:hypothetical protein
MSKNLYVFGGGKFYKKNRELIRKRYLISGIIDNSVKSEEYDEEEDLYVYNPQIILGRKDIRVLITSKKYYRAIFNQLINEFNVDSKDIEFFVGENIVSDNNRICFMTDEGSKIPFENEDELELLKRKYILEQSINNKAIKELKLQPDSLDGHDYGTPVDRYYIEKFVEKYKNSIRGTVLEVQDDRYTKKFGLNVEKSIICHVKGENNARLINFESGEGVQQGLADCIICTQTLQFIYSLDKAIWNLYNMLKDNGTLLITVPGIKPISTYHNERWGEYWSFTKASMTRLCDIVASQYEVNVYGNLKASVAFLNGSCAEEFSIDELDALDNRYPMIIGAMIKKVEDQC